MRGYFICQCLASEGVTSSHPLTHTVQVRDLAGRLVLEKSGIGVGAVDLDLKGFRSGVYMVFFVGGDVRLVGRFVKN